LLGDRPKTLLDVGAPVLAAPKRLPADWLRAQREERL
jgi:hypothetical protein